MTLATHEDALRPQPGGLKPVVTGWLFGLLPLVFRILRKMWPIPHFGNMVIATRYDDVREVFLNDAAFGTPYRAKLDVIMGGQPFFLGMGDTEDYRRDIAAMRKVVLQSDIPTRLAPAVEKMAQDIVTNAAGRLEVVDALVRQVTFKVYADYFGIPDPPGHELRVWGTRLFEFQFADPGGDAALRKEVDIIAPALHTHIQNLIAARRASGITTDDVLGRCLRMQAINEPGFSDDQIHTALMGFVVGGPPQPPMVVPQALEQLLRRPHALKSAHEAARAGDAKLLAGYVFEAMRFDPLAPALPRVALADAIIARGTPRATNVAKGASLVVAMSSAMMDERRITDPYSFNPQRLPHECIHFGYGLHTCFGIHMNLALLPLMLKPLLMRTGLRRARGRDGYLKKRGAFSDQLYVEYDR
jgi:cytochrome P450